MPRGVKEWAWRRFWRFVDKSGECWLWTGGVNNKGYGEFNVDTLVMYAHRVSWELANGEIPDGMNVCHTCDTPPCVNPSSLPSTQESTPGMPTENKYANDHTDVLVDYVRAIASNAFDTDSARRYKLHAAADRLHALYHDTPSSARVSSEGTSEPKSKIDAEVGALAKAYEALRPLDKAGLERALEYLEQRLTADLVSSLPALDGRE